MKNVYLILQNFVDVKIESVPAGLVNAPLFVKLKKKNSNIQIGQLRSVPRNTSHLVESARQSPVKNKHQELRMLTKLWKRRKKSARLSRTLGNAEPVVTSERRFRRSCEEGREFGTIRPLYLSSGRRRKSKKNERRNDEGHHWQPVFYFIAFSPDCLSYCY